MIHRFASVPMLSMYYRYAWPAFLALNALTIFALVRALASPGVAVLSAVLILVGGDLSYLAAWLLPHADVNWDYVLWPTNFLSPTMEVLHFATWGPSLPVFFTALYAIVRGLETRGRGWIVLSAFLIAVLFEFKPFAYIVLMTALCAAAVFSGSDSPARRRFAATVALGVLFSLPSLIGAATIDPSDRRSRLVIDLLLLPKRMLIKIDLTAAFASAASPCRRGGCTTPVPAPGDAGVSIVGLALVWGWVPRASGGPSRQGGSACIAAWRLLGWGVVAGIAIPFVVATEPYVDTLQFYLTGLYLLWIFAAVASSRSPAPIRELGAGRRRGRSRPRSHRRFTIWRASGPTLSGRRERRSPATRSPSPSTCGPPIQSRR